MVARSPETSSVSPTRFRSIEADVIHRLHKFSGKLQHEAKPLEGLSTILLSG